VALPGLVVMAAAIDAIVTHQLANAVHIGRGVGGNTVTAQLAAR
jgi:hypothetical protein